MNAWAVVALVSLLGLAAWDRWPTRLAAWLTHVHGWWLKKRERGWQPPGPGMDGGNR